MRGARIMWLSVASATRHQFWRPESVTEASLVVTLGSDRGSSGFLYKKNTAIFSVVTMSLIFRKSISAYTISLYTLTFTTLFLKMSDIVT